MPKPIWRALRILPLWLRRGLFLLGGGAAVLGAFVLGLALSPCVLLARLVAMPRPAPPAEAAVKPA